MKHPVLPPLHLPRLSNTTLKVVALCAMVLDHCAVALWLPAGLAGSAMGQAVYTGLRIAGRVALILYAHLLVEGFVHTHSKLRYMLRLLLLALLSEIPYDLAVWGKPFAVQNQNVLWTFTLALGMLCLLQKAKQHIAPRRVQAIVSLAVVAAAAVCALPLDGSSGCVLLVAGMYVFRQDHRAYWLACVGGIAILYVQFGWLQLFALAALPLLQQATGQRGRERKWVFYLFYPVHLLLLGTLRFFLLGG